MWTPNRTPIGRPALTATVLALALALGPPRPADAACTFTLGFKALRDQIPAIVGDCLVDAHYNSANGDALQESTGGLLVWRKADNFTAFTDGGRTWVAGPSGLQSRLNSESFEWEGGTAAAPATSPAPAPVAPPVAAVPAPSAPGAGPLVDNFDGLAAGVLPRQHQDPDVELGYGGGEYHLRQITRRGVVGIVKVPGEFRDASLSINARIVGPVEGRVIGVGCRRQADGGGYQALLAPATQRYNVSRSDGLGKPWIELETAERRDVIRRDAATNQIELSCVGPAIGLRINGVAVVTLQDRTYGDGSFYITAYAGGNDRYGEAAFDDLIVTPR